MKRLIVAAVFWAIFSGGTVVPVWESAVVSAREFLRHRGAAATSHPDENRPAELNWKDYTQEYKAADEVRDAETYPENYADFAEQTRVYGVEGFDAPISGWSIPGGYWSAPIYSPQRGDLLVGINGHRIIDYAGFLREIRYSPPVIYLTLIDSFAGYVYEMRTLMGPPNPRGARLGLVVVNDLFGGVRVTGVAPGSPAARCQYRIGYRYGFGFFPGEYIPDPQPWPGPLPHPQPWPQPWPGPVPRPETTPEYWSHPEHWVPGRLMAPNPNVEEPIDGPVGAPTGGSAAGAFGDGGE